ncbi:hypothetical protein AAZX31_16G153500 [Glycine max]
MLYSNLLNGIIPSWCLSLPSLVDLYLSENKFSGHISAISSYSLERLSLSHVKLQGNIPESIFSLVNLTQLDLSSNNLQGNIPEAIFSLVNLIDLDLSSNNLSESVNFPLFSKLQNLRRLNLSQKRLIGPIPQSMGNLRNLESLDLSSNMLTGRIPTELGNLNFLEVLNLSDNHFVGEIPQGKQFRTFSNDSYEGNLGLCGLPLTTECSKDPEQHSPASLTFGGEQGVGFGWKPVAIGHGCGMVFGVGMGCCVLLIGKPQWLVRMVGGQLNKKVKRKTRMKSNENGS